MAKQSAANMQTLARLDELHAELIAQADRVAALNITDVRDTIHDIANRIVQIADALPGIIARIEEIARWIAEYTGKPVVAISAPGNRPDLTGLGKPVRSHKEAQAERTGEPAVAAPDLTGLGKPVRSRKKE